MSDCKIKVEERIGSVLISAHQEENGVLHGAYVWKENGLFVAQGFFQYGSPHGLWIYYKEGQVIGEKLWDNGYIQGSVAYKDGRLESVTIKPISNERRIVTNEQIPFDYEARNFLHKIAEMREAQSKILETLSKKIALEEEKYRHKYPIARQTSLIKGELSH